MLSATRMETGDRGPLTGQRILADRWQNGVGHPAVSDISAATVLPVTGPVFLVSRDSCR